MADLIVFINRDDLPIGLQAPVAHAQFETIHPFVDGNGRTGRALIHAMLKNAGILVHTTAPISAGLLTDTKGYFAALASYRAGDARPIVERFADAARFAAITGRDLVDQLANQLTQARDKLAGVRPQSAAWSVLPHLIAHPVVSSAFLRQHLGLGEVTVNRALTVLTERGVLAETTGLKRNRVWQHVGILDVLNTYAEALSRQ
jgi:Fic family protein